MPALSAVPWSGRVAFGGLLRLLRRHADRCPSHRRARHADIRFLSWLRCGRSRPWVRLGVLRAGVLGRRGRRGWRQRRREGLGGCRLSAARRRLGGCRGCPRCHGGRLGRARRRIARPDDQDKRYSDSGGRDGDERDRCLLGAIPRRPGRPERQRAAIRGAKLTVDRPGIDRGRREPSGRWRRHAVASRRGFVAFCADVVHGFAAWRLGGLFHRQVVSCLLTAEPPVVFVRVALPVVEAPIRPGFALNHTPMLALTCSALADRALSRWLCALKCWCINGFRCRREAPPAT